MRRDRRRRGHHNCRIMMASAGLATSHGAAHLAGLLDVVASRFRPLRACAPGCGIRHSVASTGAESLIASTWVRLHAVGEVTIMLAAPPTGESSDLSRRTCRALAIGVWRLGCR